MHSKTRSTHRRSKRPDLRCVIIDLPTSKKTTEHLGLRWSTKETKTRLRNWLLLLLENDSVCHLNIVTFKLSSRLVSVLNDADHRSFLGKDLILDRTENIWCTLKLFKTLVRGKLEQRQRTFCEVLPVELQVDWSVGKGVVF